MKSLMKTLNRVLNKFEEDGEPKQQGPSLEEQKAILDRMDDTPARGAGLYSKVNAEQARKRLHQPPPFDSRKLGGAAGRSGQGQSLMEQEQSRKKSAKDGILRDLAKDYNVTAMTQYQMAELADMLHRVGYLSTDESIMLAEGTNLGGVLQTPPDYVCDMISEWQKALAMELGRNDMSAVNKISRILIVLGRLAEARGIQRSVA